MKIGAGSDQELTNSNNRTGSDLNYLLGVQVKTIDRVIGASF